MLLPLYAGRGRFWHLIDSFAGPATIICFVFLVIPLLKSWDQSYFGVNAERYVRVAVRRVASSAACRVRHLR